MSAGHPTFQILYKNLRRTVPLAIFLVLSLQSPTPFALVFSIRFNMRSFVRALRPAVRRSQAVSAPRIRQPFSAAVQW